MLNYWRVVQGRREMAPENGVRKRMFIELWDSYDSMVHVGGAIKNEILLATYGLWIGAEVVVMLKWALERCSTYFKKSHNIPIRSL